MTFLVNESTISKIKDAFSIILGITSVVVMVISILLFKKYGIDKSIKEKNLDIVLKLLQEIKKVTLTFNGERSTCFFRLGKYSMVEFEDYYNQKILFPSNYSMDLNSIFTFSDDLYIPDEIKEKLDKLIPYSMARTKVIDENDYFRLFIKRSHSKDSGVNRINDRIDITLFDYLIMWDELITTIKNWINKNSDSKIDLNVK